MYVYSRNYKRRTMQSQQNGLYLYMITLKALNSDRNARATIRTTNTKTNASSTLVRLLSNSTMKFFLAKYIITLQ